MNLQLFYLIFTKMKVFYIFSAICFIIIGSSVVTVVDGYNFLMLGVMPFYSHLMMMTIIGNELISRGHNITYITIKPLKPHPHMNVIINEDKLQKYFQAGTMDKLAKGTGFTLFDLLYECGTSGMDDLLATDIFQKLIHSKLEPDSKDPYSTKFDAILSETHLIHETLVAGMAQKYDCQIITYAPILMPSYTAYMVGDPYHPAYMSDYKNRFTSNMDFFQRIHNTALAIYSIIFHNTYLDKVDGSMRQFFAHLGAQKWPHIKDILRQRQALTLIDTHRVLTDAIPHNPNVFDIGGLHIKPAKPLPAELEKYMNSSDHGVIYFAMGSVIDSQHLAQEKKDILVNFFSTLKQNVIWKLNDPELNKTLPKNVKMEKWLPQNDILGHPNCKLFITHGGIHSAFEAIYNKVPMFVIPLFADQYQNGVKASEKGYGETMDFHNMNLEELQTKTHKILSNPRYKQKIEQISNIFRSEREHPLEMAMYQIEYVMRHKGADYLKTKVTDLEWYQFLLLDVLVFMLAILLIGLYVIYKAFRIVFSLFGVGKKGLKTKKEDDVNNKKKKK